MKISYDPKCEELANYFLASIGAAGREAQVQSLAGAIQRAIEDWIWENDGERPLAEPEDESGQGGEGWQENGPAAG